MIQHGLEEVCNIDNTKSSNLELSLEQPNAASTKLLDQYVLITTHVVVSMNFTKNPKNRTNQ
jgi:hypothetical protein